jgi:spore maturation protein CgeB
METTCLIALHRNPLDNWNKVFEVHLLAELKEVFDKVILLYENDFKDLLEYNNHIVSHFKSNNADLFITSFNEKTIFIETINEIKKNSKTLLFCPDNVNEPFFHKKVAKSYDLVWLCDKETSYLFNKWSSNYIYMPWACNPNLFKGLSSQLIPRVLFVGNVYGHRINQINELLDNGIPVDLFTGFTSSNGTHIPSKKSLIATLRFTGIKKMINFIRYKEGRKILIARLITSFRKKSLDTSNPILRIYDSVDYDKLAEIIPSYRLVLTSTAARNTGVLSKPVNHIVLKCFETASMGGLQITNYSSELEFWFSDEKEAVYYNSENLREKFNKYLYLLTDQEIRTLQSNARFKAKEFHSNRARIEIIAKLLSIMI